MGRALARDMGVPQITTFHTLSLIKMQARAGESEPVQRQRVERELIAEADRVVAFSPHERDAMVRLYGADANRITLAPCGVDLSRFQPLDQEESRRRLGLNGEKVLLYVGRMESLKGLGPAGPHRRADRDLPGSPGAGGGGDDGKQGRQRASGV